MRLGICLWKMLSCCKKMSILCVRWNVEMKTSLNSMKLKIEHIDNLRRGKKSGINIGSRGTPHHLFAHETVLYEKALKERYLIVDTKNRVNLKNLWNKVCQAKWRKEWVLEKDTVNGVWIIYCGKDLIETWDLKKMKLKIKSMMQIWDI